MYHLIRLHPAHVSPFSGKASARGRESIGGVGGASQDGAGEKAEPGRDSDTAGDEGVRVAADRQQEQEGEEGEGGSEGQGWKEGQEIVVVEKKTNIF